MPNRSLVAFAVLATCLAYGTPSAAQNFARHYEDSLRAEVFSRHDYQLARELRFLNKSITGRADPQIVAAQVNHLRKERAELEQSARSPNDIATMAADTFQKMSSGAGLLGRVTPSLAVPTAQFLLDTTMNSVADEYLAGLSHSEQLTAQHLLSLENSHARRYAATEVHAFVALLAEDSPRGAVARNLASLLGYDDRVGGHIGRDPSQDLEQRLAKATTPDTAKRLAVELKSGDKPRQEAAVTELLSRFAEAAKNDRKAAADRAQDAWERRSSDAGIDVVAAVLASNPNQRQFAQDFATVGHALVELRALFRERSSLKNTALNNIGMAFNVTALAIGVIQACGPSPANPIIEALQQLMELQKETLDAVRATHNAVLSLDRKIDLYFASLTDDLTSVRKDLAKIHVDIDRIQQYIIDMNTVLKQLKDRIDTLSYGEIWTDVATVQRRCLLSPPAVANLAWFTDCVDRFGRISGEQAKSPHSSAASAEPDYPPALLFPRVHSFLGAELAVPEMAPVPNPDVWAAGAGMGLAFLRHPLAKKVNAAPQRQHLLTMLHADGSNIVNLRHFLDSSETRKQVADRYTNAIGRFSEDGLQELWQRALEKTKTTSTASERTYFSQIAGCSAPAPTINSHDVVDIVQEHFGDWLALMRADEGQIQICGELVLRINSRVQGQQEVWGYSGGGRDRERYLKHARRPTVCNGTITARPHVKFTRQGHTVELADFPLRDVASTYLEMAPEASPQHDCGTATLASPPFYATLNSNLSGFSAAIIQTLRQAPRGVVRQLAWPGLPESTCTLAASPDARCGLDTLRTTLWLKELRAFRASFSADLATEREGKSATAFSISSRKFDERTRLLRVAFKAGLLGHGAAAEMKVRAVDSLPDSNGLAEDLDRSLLASSADPRESVLVAAGLKRRMSESDWIELALKKMVTTLQLQAGTVKYTSWNELMRDALSFKRGNDDHPVARATATATKAVELALAAINDSTAPGSEGEEVALLMSLLEKEIAALSKGVAPGRSTR